MTHLPTLRESGGFPARRHVIAAAQAQSAPMSWDAGSINVPRAQDRLLEAFEREQLPGDVRSTLAAALHGDLHYQGLLFSAMIDSWPKLQKNLSEIARQVSIAPWKVHPFAMRGDKPRPRAERFAREVEAIAWRMKPDPARGELGMEGIIKAVALWYYLGHGVAEIRWTQAADGTWTPRAAKDLPARYFGYPYDVTSDDPEDRLMLDPTGSLGARNFIDFPAHRFLIGVNKGHNGHPTMAAPLRSLTAYWLSAVYGLKWFMNFTQLYGIPWRHAEVANPTEENAVKSALANIGANGYIVTKTGTKINILAPASTSGEALPQKALIDLADQQCDQFILGATLTGGTDGSGSRALGEVHEGVKNGVVDAIADFVGEILTHQFIPAIVAANWGPDQADLPEMWAKRENPKDEKALAERDEKIGITSGKVPVGKAWFYERHGIPMPADGEETLTPAALPIEPSIAPSSTIAAADASKADVDRLESLMRQAEEAIAGDGIIDEDAVASMLAAAWLDGAKTEP